MMNTVLTLVFSIVMLVFMAYPAMKIVEWVDAKFPIKEQWRNIAVVVVTILLSLVIGLFLRFF